MACLQLLGVIKTIVGCLDKHRDLKDNQELRAELNNKVCLQQGGHSFKTGGGGCFIYYIEIETENQTE